MIETDLDIPATDPDRSTPRSAPRKVRRKSPWRLPLLVLATVLLVLAAAAGNILAPITPPPPTTFPSGAGSPVTTARAVSPSATPLPAQLRQRAEIAYVNGLISHMTLDEEIGQMIMIGFSETQMDSSLAYEIQQYHVGSAIMYAFNIQTTDQLKSLISGLQSASSLPLLIATDQEGGSVNRMATIEGLLTSAAEMGATNNPAYVQRRGSQDAAALASVGINLNLAPVVDVLNTSGGDVTNRSFGSTPSRVITMAGAYLTGLQASGQVVGTLKHFPGLGDVPVDPHTTLYTLNRSQVDLNRIDWAPYRALISTGDVYAVMSTHIILASVDPTRPASLSQPVLTGILRDQLGFNGVIITDGIYMAALSTYGLDQIAVDAVEAGNDIICSTYSIESTAEVIAVIKAAVSSGQLTKSRIDDSVRRILLLKLRLGLLPGPHIQPITH